MPAHNFVNLIGSPPFGYLTVVDRGDNTSDGKAQWWCTCLCGTRCLVIGKLLRCGDTRSCGCLKKARIQALRYSHGLRYSPEYGIWLGMKQRCLNPKTRNYADYGGRGIVICDSWKESFATFYSDMGPRPSPQHSLDRYPDCNGPYSRENCRWATLAEQARNTRRNQLITLDGQTLCLKDWLQMKKLSPAAFYGRVDLGYTPEEALTMPRLRAKPIGLITIDGRTESLQRWLEIKDMLATTVKARRQKGWSIEDALTMPVHPHRPYRRRLNNSHILNTI